MCKGCSEATTMIEEKGGDVLSWVVGSNRHQMRGDGSGDVCQEAQGEAG